MWRRQWLGGLAGVAVLAWLMGCSSGRPPSNLGVTAGRLASCPGSPNCVSSEAAVAEQRVEPLRYDGDAAQAHARLLDVLNGMERVRIVQSTDDYLHAEFRSAVFGFVDDVEFYFSPPGTLQVRSASRTGYSDFGVNRQRVETLRARFSPAANSSGTTARLSGCATMQMGSTDAKTVATGSAGGEVAENANPSSSDAPLPSVPWRS